MTDPNSVELAAELTIAWLSNPSTRASADEVETFLRTMRESVAALAAQAAPVAAAEEAPAEHAPAVSVRKSLASPDHLISLIDGRPYRTLKRHLATNGLTPDEYRQRYGLKPDYPMVAPSYSEARRETAKRLGLGRKPAAPAPAEQLPEPARKPRGRKSAAEAKAAAQAHLAGGR